jgi:hypothetical protein
MEDERSRKIRSCRLLKNPASKAAVDESTGGVPLGYVEDAFEGRTPLAGFFSSLLKTGGLPIYHPHSGQNQRDAEDFARTH